MWVVAAEAPVVQGLFAIYFAIDSEEGTGRIGLAKALGRRGIVTPNGYARWNAATVRGILTNPSDTGQIYARRSRARPARGRHTAPPARQWRARSNTGRTASRAAVRCRR